jgi:hypothetical protein
LNRAFQDLWAVYQRAGGGADYLDDLTADPPAVAAKLRGLLPAEDEVTPDAVVES